MIPEQQYLLEDKHLPIYIYSQKDLFILKTIVEDELNLRQDIRNKELKLKLAKDVWAKTGNDDNIETLKEDLFLARKKIAKRLSDMDQYKHYYSFIPKDKDGKIIPASDEKEMVYYSQLMI